MLRALNRAEVTHKLRGALRDERTALPKLLCIHNSVVALIGSREPRELISMRHPVKRTRINNAAANARTMTIHVLGGGMSNDIRTPFNRVAVNRRRERVVHDQRHAMSMRRIGKTLDIQNSQRRVRNRLAKHALSVRAESGFKLLVRAIRAHKRALETHTMHGMSQKIVGTTIDSARCNNMIASTSNIKHSKEVRSLTGAGQHCSSAALHLANLRSNIVVGRVLQTSIEVARFLQVKQLTHMLRSIILPRSGLINRNLTRLRIARTITTLHARSAHMLGHTNSSSQQGHIET